MKQIYTAKDHYLNKKKPSWGTEQLDPEQEAEIQKEFKKTVCPHSEFKN